MLGVDKFSAILDPDGVPDKDRPDLVFVMSDTAAPHVVTIVEFKSPSVPLALSHLAQLKGYMRRVEAFVETELKQRVVVKGYLIGAMPAADTKAQDEAALLYEIRKEWSAKSDWEVLGLEQLLQRAQAIHSDAIDALEAAEKEEPAPEAGKSSPAAIAGSAASAVVPTTAGESEQKAPESSAAAT